MLITPDYSMWTPVAPGTRMHCHMPGVHGRPTLATGTIVAVLCSADPDLGGDLPDDWIVVLLDGETVPRCMLLDETWPAAR